MPSPNPFSKFLPTASISNSIPRKEKFRDSSQKNKTATWLETKKRGRDDERIAHDARKADQIRKNFLAKRRGITKSKPPRKNSDSSEEEDDDDLDDMNGFIVASDEEIETYSSEEESFLPKTKKRCIVKKVTMQTLANIQYKNNSRNKKKAPPKKMSSLSAKYLNRSVGKDSLCDDTSPLKDAMSPQDIILKKRSTAIQISSSDDEQKKGNRFIIDSDDDDIPVGKKLCNDFEDLSSDDDIIAPKKRLQKKNRTIDLCEDESDVVSDKEVILIQSEDEMSITKSKKRLKKGTAKPQPMEKCSAKVSQLSTEDPFSQSDNEPEDNDQYIEEAEREAGSILTSANQLSAQILKRMRECCFGSSSTSSSIPKGMIVDGALALFKEDMNSNSSNVFITKSILKEILSPDIQLKEYQRIGVNWMALLHTMKCNVEGKETNVNGVLADEMGLGKTIQTIAFLAWLKYYRAGDGEHKPHIVIVPASVLTNWQNEFKKVCPSLSIVKYHGTMAERAEIKEDLRKALYNPTSLDVILTTFSYFSSEKADDRNFLRKFDFDYMVVDEAHCLKNPKGSRYKNMDKFSTEHRLLLTGTPVQNSAEELMSLLCFLMPLFSNKGNKFDEDGNDGGAKMLQHFITLGGKSERENYNKLKQLFSPFVLRRKKVDCLNQMLPPKMRKLEIVPLTPKVRSMYDSILSAHIEKKSNNSITSGAVTTSLFTELRKAANHPLLLRNRHKSQEEINHLSNTLYTNGYFGNQCDINLVKKELESFSDYDIHCAIMTILEEKPYLKNEVSRYIATEDDLFESPKFALLQTMIPSLIREDHRILIFSQWTRCLDLIEHLMSHLNLQFMRLDGQTSVSERQSLIDEFTNDENYKVFLLSTRAGGLGINLTCADTCILHDLDFNPFNDLQAEDRCHRIGQKKPVTVIKMVAEDTVETDIHAMQERKARMNAAILENNDSKSRKNEKVEEEKEVSNIIQTAMDRYLTQH